MILHVKYIADRITSHDRGFSISYIVIISSFYPWLYLYVIFTNAVSILTIQKLTDFIIIDSSMLTWNLYIFLIGLMFYINILSKININSNIYYVFIYLNWSKTHNIGVNNPF